jgi:hypothetical protein
VLGSFQINTHGAYKPFPPVSTFYSLYNNLPITLKRFCGEITLPMDGGAALMHHLQTHQTPLIGMSDASLKDGQCSHAWVLSTGNPDHISNENMSIQGAGAVDGAPEFMSYARGELHGQTAMAIISTILLEAHNSPNMKITLHSDNKGVQHTCAHIQTNRLKHHRQSNIDLKNVYKQASQG